MEILKHIVKPEVKELPMLNYLESQSTQPFLQDYRQISRKKRLMYMVQRTPEAYSIIEAHARDIADSFHFEVPGKKNGQSKTRVSRAKNFVQRNRFRKLLLNVVMDVIITGEGYIHKKELNRQQITMLQQEFTRALKTDYDEDFFKLRSVREVASTTMSVQHDGYSVTAYTQQVAQTGDPLEFTLNEIIRTTFGEMNGKVEGWTPLLLMPLHFELLALLWGNQYDFQAKGNHPDMIVMAETMRSNQPGFRKLEQDLRKYNTPGNSKHGTLLMSADAKFSIQQLERMDSLQFKEVGDFIQTLFASLFQFPVSRLGIKTAEAAKSKDSNNSADKSYWNAVEQKQDLLAENLNSQLWLPYFGVEMVFDKSYKHDDVVENTAQGMRLDNLSKLNGILLQQGKRLSNDVLLRAFNERSIDLSEDDFEEVEDGSNLEVPQQNSTFRQGFGAKPSTMSDTERNQKREDELARESNQGKPSGV